VGGDNVILQVYPSVLIAAGDVGVGAQVKDHLVPSHSFRQGGQIPKICLLEAEARMAQEVPDPVYAAEGEVVVGGNEVSLRQQVFRQMAADEAGPTGYEIPALPLVFSHPSPPLLGLSGIVACTHRKNGGCRYV